MKNVYIIGPQCTGKTTLSHAVEEALDEQRTYDTTFQQPTMIREVARGVLKDKGFSREDIMTSPIRTLQLQTHILEAQYDAEMAADASKTSSWYICDRSGLDPIVYAYKHVKPEAAAEMLQSEIWSDLEARMKQGIVILCEAGCHWLIDDGTRLMPTTPEDWEDVDNVFRQLLQDRGIKYSVISRDMIDLGERVQFVRGLIDASQAQES